MKIWLLNIILAGFAVFAGIKAYELWMPGEEQKTEAGSEVKQKTKTFRPKKRFVKRRIPPESDYAVVREKNLFSPDRKEFVPEEVEEPEPEVKKVSLSGKKITLYGVIMAGNQKSALINNFERKTPGERDSRWVKIGDTVEGMKISNIRKDSILLIKGDEKYEVLLYDKTKNRTVGKAKKSEISPTVVVSESKKEKQEPKAEKKKEPEKPEYHMINTPFGKMKIRKKKPLNRKENPKP